LPEIQINGGVELIDENRKEIEAFEKVLEKLDKKQISVDLIIQTLLGKDIDDEMIEYIRIALESNEDGFTMKDIVIGVLDLNKWREDNC
jgi:biotin synthase-related radical SAM superfamily protein